jgi:hypothetical protein
MSEKRIAASSPKRSMGRRVAWAASSGVLQSPEGGLLPDLLILGHVAARLAHDPDRRPIEALAATGPEEEIVFDGRAGDHGEAFR